ncbi:MAG: hypothetical protein D6769_00485 [Methanobacteriota archaeon]|nr:MAG: hypothetical protein D6769_00485 [Euryarchaeota archaeon]
MRGKLPLALSAMVLLLFGCLSSNNPPVDVAMFSGTYNSSYVGPYPLLKGNATVELTYNTSSPSLLFVEMHRDVNKDGKPGDGDGTIAVISNKNYDVGVHSIKSNVSIGVPGPYYFVVRSNGSWKILVKQ